MYDRDMPLMRQHALASPQGLVDVVGFVLCTIQMPLSGVKNQMADVRINGAQSKYLFGSKRTGYQYALDHAPVLHAALVAATDNNDVIGIVDVLSNVPGLGVVKASFVAQICGLQVACLDTHNLRRLNLSESAFKMPKGLSHATRLTKIKAYVGACRKGAPRDQRPTFAAYWWNSWCASVAGSRFNKSLPTADAVSAYHWECLA